jgi:DNA-binding CsgD family transcriptional regulator
MTPNLTSREQQVLDLIIAGKTAKGIGAQLGISHRTVEVHRALIKLKLGATSSTDLVRIALTRKTAGSSSSRSLISAVRCASSGFLPSRSARFAVSQAYSRAISR